MKLEIKEKKENKLLGRTEVEGKITFEGAVPSNETVKDKLAAELNADKSLIVIKHIYPKFSSQEAVLLAFVYENAEGMDKTEMMTKHLKKKAEGEKKAAEEKPVEEAPAEEKKEETAEEKPKEEVKEEASKEEKKEGKE